MLIENKKKKKKIYFLFVFSNWMLYILQVWRKFDFETADKLARRKAGEFLDPDLSILLEQREKRMEREKRDRAKEGSSNPKRFRGGASQYGESF